MGDVCALMLGRAWLRALRSQLARQLPEKLPAALLWAPHTCTACDLIEGGYFAPVEDLAVGHTTKIEMIFEF